MNLLSILRRIRKRKYIGELDDDFNEKLDSEYDLSDSIDLEENDDCLFCECYEEDDCEECPYLNKGGFFEDEDYEDCESIHMLDAVECPYREEGDDLIGMCSKTGEGCVI